MGQLKKADPCQQVSIQIQKLSKEIHIHTPKKGIPLHEFLILQISMPVIGQRFQRLACGINQVN